MIPPHILEKFIETAQWYSVLEVSQIDLPDGWKSVSSQDKIHLVDPQGTTQVTLKFIKERKENE